MTYSSTIKWLLLNALIVGLLVTNFPAKANSAEAIELLNVSYDPTREFYEQVNPIFAEYWKSKTGQEVTINQSHGGSGKQARAVIDGLQADIVTLALAFDIDEIVNISKKLPQNWQESFPHNSSPYTSTIVFLVRKGNPKNIKNWDDLAKNGVSVITPNPKTSGGARWNYLAAWAYADKKFGGDEAKIKEFIHAIYKNVPILDSGARGSLTSFAERGIGDVFISWENEAFLASKQLGADKFEIVVPSLSILAEPPVALVEANANKKGTTEVAKAYLEFLYTKEAQELAAKNYYRPIDKEIAAKFASQFPQINLVTIEQFGGWKNAQQKHFADGGTFDEIYKK